MMIQYLSKLVEKTPIISTICSSLMMGLITVALAGGPPPGTTKPPTQPSTGKPTEVEENTEPRRRQPPASQPSGGQEKPVEAEPERSEPRRRQPPNVGNPGGQQQEINQIPPQFPEPAGRVTPVEGLITLRLINHTDAVIRYQVIGGRHRTLGERSVVEIYELPVPLTLTYQRPDGGLLLVSPRGISPRVLEVRFNSTENFDLDTKSLNITGTGGVFLN
ncbi:MAG: hypothetical protein F6K08_16180 [Okeania sp. SIO1H6]|nr:hypothetical protein [Okeania sp. SIO1H6]